MSTGYAHVPTGELRATIERYRRGLVECRARLTDYPCGMRYGHVVAHLHQAECEMAKR